MVLRLENITQSYSNKLVLDNLNVSLDGNQVVGLVGRNGAGKSTLLRIIAGVLSPNQGRLHLDITDVGRSISYMSENTPLYDEMYVYEFLHWVNNSLKNSVTKKEIEESAEELGLHEVRSKKIYELSKGYKQRTGLAAAFLGNPSICLLDEPINGLDPAQIMEFRKVIRKQAKNKLVILSSHLLQEIEAVCDEVMILEDGQLCLASDRSQIIYQLVTASTANDSALVQSFLGDTTVFFTEAYCEFNVESEEQLDALIKYLITHDVKIRQLRPLRQIFNNLVNLTPL